MFSPCANILVHYQCELKGGGGYAKAPDNYRDKPSTCFSSNKNYWDHMTVVGYSISPATLEDGYLDHLSALYLLTRSKRNPSKIDSPRSETFPKSDACACVVASGLVRPFLLCFCRYSRWRRERVSDFSPSRITFEHPGVCSELAGLLLLLLGTAVFLAGLWSPPSGRATGNGSDDVTSGFPCARTDSPGYFYYGFLPAAGLRCSTRRCIMQPIWRDFRYVVT